MEEQKPRTKWEARIQQWKKSWEMYKENKIGLVGIGLLVFFFVFAVLGFVMPHIDPIYHPMTGFDPFIVSKSPPSITHLLGTDFWGRDIMSQLMSGAQIAFLIGLTAAVVAVAIGTTVGLVSGYYGGTTDTLLMRTVDIVLTLPFLPLIIVVSAAVGKQSIWVLVLIIALLSWGGISRVIRSQTLSLKQRPFVEAARVAGATDARIIFRHIGPNVLPLSFLYMSFLVLGAILTEAGVSYLGLGDPTRVSWGIMLQWCRTTGSTFTWYWMLPPGLCITLMTLSFYLIGRAVDEIVNPRLRKR
ncbi:MAG: ABC transporter permease [Theionarchaea archaeon]|nr:ABC transporter permease [Theionarchaea archaeon]MBU7038193.1 ABC transporter permease [Theionarchaea archaeon]